jgi:hypothetical protein
MFCQNIGGLRTKGYDFFDNVYIGNHNTYNVWETWLNDKICSSNIFSESMFHAARDYSDCNKTLETETLIAVSRSIYDLELKSDLGIIKMCV